MTTTVSMTDVSRDWSSSQAYSRPQSEVFAYEKVLVVLDGSRQITKYALEWALSNVLVRAGESITLIALHTPGGYGTHAGPFSRDQIPPRSVAEIECLFKSDERHQDANLESSPGFGASPTAGYSECG
jgi:hypothetical protein